MNKIARYPLRFRPTNKEFLFMVADYIEESEKEIGKVLEKGGFTKKTACDRITLNF